MKFENLGLMLTMLGATALGILIMIGGFAAHGSPSDGGFSHFVLIIGLLVVIGFGLATLGLGIQFGYDLGVAGRELPKPSDLLAETGGSPSPATEPSAS